MFPDILKNLRIEKNMSQQELADIVGKTQQAVYLWEKGEETPFQEGPIKRKAHIQGNIVLFTKDRD